MDWSSDEIGSIVVRARNISPRGLGTRVVSVDWPGPCVWNNPWWMQLTHWDLDYNWQNNHLSNVVWSSELRRRLHVLAAIYIHVLIALRHQNTLHVAFVVRQKPYRPKTEASWTLVSCVSKYLQLWGIWTRLYWAHRYCLHSVLCVVTFGLFDTSSPTK